MKKILFISLFLLPLRAHAWEFPRNPDRFPSVGFNVANTNLTGTRSEISQPNNPALTLAYNGSLKRSDYSIGGDLRLPVSDQLTFTLFADSVNSDTTFNRAQNVYKETDKIDGYRYGLNIRLYFSK